MAAVWAVQQLEPLQRERGHSSAKTNVTVCASLETKSVLGESGHNPLLSYQVFLVSFLDVRLALVYGASTGIKGVASHTPPASNMQKQMGVKGITSGYRGHPSFEGSPRAVAEKLSSLER